MNKQKRMSSFNALKLIQKISVNFDLIFELNI